MILRHYLLPALAFLLVAVFLTGCGNIDPTYNRELAMARTNCKSNDIVGIWVSQLSGIAATDRMTMQLLPNGTGRCRSKVIAGTEGEGVSVREAPIRWSYSGGGVWHGDIYFPTEIIPEPIAMHYTGHKLLTFNPGLFITECVFVRADDPEAVRAHLQERRNSKPLIPDPRLMNQPQQPQLLY